MQAQKGRTKSPLLIGTKSDLSDKVFNRYFTIWPRFGTGYFQFGPIYPDLVIRVTGNLMHKFMLPSRDWGCTSHCSNIV